jgi:aminoglycoside phosphotransferase (APT) family kinase protein
MATREAGESPRRAGTVSDANAANAIAAPGWVTDAVGQDLAAARRVPWGFTNETWAATTAHGVRCAVTRMSSPATAAEIIRRGPEVARRLASVGLEMPVPIASRSRAEQGVVVSTWIEGAPGIAKLGEPGGPEAIGRALGDAWRRLAAVDPSGLGLDDRWARPLGLQGAARSWLDGLRDDLAAPVASAIAVRLDGLALHPGRVGFVHGDLVPANVLLRSPRPPALLDLEAVRVGDRLLDAAWFRWIVRYHHPDLEPVAWLAFAKAAGIDAGGRAIANLLAALPTVRILEILAESPLDEQARLRWLEQLATTVGRGMAGEEGFEPSVS